jgi:hypothetical protein
LVPTPLAPLSAAILVTMASLFPVALASASNWTPAFNAGSAGEAHHQDLRLHEKTAVPVAPST